MGVHERLHQICDLVPLLHCPARMDVLIPTKAKGFKDIFENRSVGRTERSYSPLYCVVVLRSYRIGQLLKDAPHQKKCKIRVRLIEGSRIADQEGFHFGTMLQPGESAKGPFAVLLNSRPKFGLWVEYGPVNRVFRVNPVAMLFCQL